jgi:hypothetical protein
MTLFLQNPALLGLLALGALPVLVHLLSRARPPAYAFSNIEFLRRILRRTARIRRPKDWLLLAIRCLALLALAAAFVSPFLLSKNSSLPGEKSTVILVIDRSASMAARDGAASRFEAACAEAVRFLDSSKPTTANLVWIDANPSSVFPEPGPNLEFLGDSIQQANPRPEPGALDAAFDLALRQLTRSSGRREIVIISDFQASAWKNFDPAIPPNIQVLSRRVAKSSPANVAVTRLIPQPASPVVGQELTLLARIRNFSPDPIRSQLTLDAGGSRQSQPIDLPAWGEADAAFTLRPASSGPLPITALTEPDAFPMDDARHSVVRVRDSLQLTITSPPGSPDETIFHKIAGALPWLEVSSNTSTAQQADIQLLSPWTGENPEALRKSAEAGRTLVIRPATDCPPAALASLLKLPAEPSAWPLQDNPAAWTVAPEENHPAIQMFRNGDFGNPFAGKFRQRLKLPDDLAVVPGARLIARFNDNTPALIAFETKGAPILLWNLTLDTAHTDWPLQGVFLPAIAEILLRTRPQSSAEPAQTLPGYPLSWSSNDPAHAAAVTLTGPSDEILPLRESTTAEGLEWQSEQAASPGLHRWQISGQTIDYSAVNFPDSESDLRPLEQSPAFGNLDSSPDALVRHAALAQGLPLWPSLIAAALVLLCLESLLLRTKSS